MALLGRTFGVIPGLTAAALAKGARLLIARRSLAAVRPLRADRGPSGVRLSIEPTGGFYATLGGTASPYDLAEKVAGPDGFTAGPRSCSACGYEVNGVSGLGGKLAWVEPGFPGDYRFQMVRGGGSCIITVNMPCVTAPQPGITVTATQGGTTLTYVSDSSGHFTFAPPAGGTWTLAGTPPNARVVAVPMSIDPGATHSGNVGFTPAAGYACLSPAFGCPYPIRTTLNFSATVTGRNRLGHAISGSPAGTLTWGFTGGSSYGWTGQFSYTDPDYTGSDPLLFNVFLGGQGTTGGMQIPRFDLLSGTCIGGMVSAESGLNCLPFTISAVASGCSEIVGSNVYTKTGHDDGFRMTPFATRITHWRLPRDYAYHQRRYVDSKASR